MPYRTPDEEALATRATREQSAADEATRFATALRTRRFRKLRALPRLHPFLVFLVLAVGGIFGGCYGGALTSERMGTVGDMAGAFETLGRMALGGSIGGLIGLGVAAVVSRRARKTFG